MAKENRVSFFNTKEDFGGGGGIPAGHYRFTEPMFVLWDMNGKCGVQGGVLFFQASMLPIDPKTREELGDAQQNRWQVDMGNKGERQLEPTKDGTGMVATDAFLGKLSRLVDFHMLMESLQKAGFDNDSYDNDVSVLDGLEVEIGIQAKKGGKDNEKTYNVAIVTDILKEAGKGASKNGSKTAGKPAPAAKGKPAGKSNDDDPESILAATLESEVLTDKNAKGIKKIMARMAVVKAVTKSHDAETAKAVAQLFNDNDTLTAMLEASGWELDGDTIKQS